MLLGRLVIERITAIARHLMTDKTIVAVFSCFLFLAVGAEWFRWAVSKVVR